eukprot:1159966-Pelagomonas_calceolata.AAC.3
MEGVACLLDTLNQTRVCMYSVRMCAPTHSQHTCMRANTPQGCSSRRSLNSTTHHGEVARLSAAAVSAPGAAAPALAAAIPAPFPARPALQLWERPPCYAFQHILGCP